MQSPLLLVLCAAIIICGLVGFLLYKRNRANQEVTARDWAAQKINTTSQTTLPPATRDRRPRSYLDMPSTPTPAYLKRMEELDKKISEMYTFDHENLRVERKKLTSGKDTWGAFLTTQQKKGNRKSIAQSHAKKAGQEERAEVS